MIKKNKIITISLKISPKNSYKKKFSIFPIEDDSNCKKSPRSNNLRVFEGFNENSVPPLESNYSSTLESESSSN